MMEPYLHIYSAIQAESWQWRSRHHEVFGATGRRPGATSPLGPCGLAPVSATFGGYAG
jgi:hypothetical protein